jgi:ring-1,2-phenylacetyl-CoA epoxidase subunit PaaE
MDASTTRRRARFNDLTISQVRTLTDDAIEVSFTVPENLVDDYSYSPGQYIALRATVEGEDVRRSYSICQAPVAGELKVGIKRDLGGLFSTWAIKNLKPGMQLSVMMPEGAFALAADPRNRFSLVYSNRTAMETMFVDELADLKDRYPTRLALYHVLTRETRSSELLSGRLDEQKINEILQQLISPTDVNEWFICGPFDLVQMVRDTLAEHGVAADDVRYELFTTGRPEGLGGQSGRPIVVQAGQDVHTITFRLDGTSATVTTPVHSNESILNAALRVRPDVPFACAGGVCGTCRATVVSGTVNMVENYALEPDELERGYVLTCQSIPTSEFVEINYDS